jgi:mono/diheme cytochrome c family protein
MPSATLLQPGVRRLFRLNGWLCLALLFPSASKADDLSGERIYRQQCASCHGVNGEGTEKEYPQALTGDRSVAQLAKFIAKSMPKEAPRKCTPEEAAKVAAYIYDAFYSKDAQTRNKPPRVELSRLTVRQYRNAVTDLIGSFRPAGHLDSQRGLQGEYFKNRHFRTADRVLERLDPEIRFDFGTAGPVPEKFDPLQFSIRWRGSVLATETGDYEFIVRTEHAARLWVNDQKRPLIDAWVKSGTDNEYHATLHLLGGWAYPLRLEFSKAKQGVDDSNKKKAMPPEVKASIALEWKPPRQAAEVIPPRNLLPATWSEAFVLMTPFPPDDRSMGYERGTSISKAWDQATTDAAIEVAGYVGAHLRDLADVRDDSAARGQRLQEFCRQFVERAFRRPLTAEQKQVYLTHQFTAARDLDNAVKRVVLLALKSPHFLYREVEGGRDPYTVAARLSFGLWDSLPDKELLECAAAGKLVTSEQVARQAERMVTDWRSRAKVRAYFRQWLKVDPAPDLSKARDQFPSFDQAAASDLRTSLDLFLDDVVWGPASDYRQLFLADYLYLNGRLARLYGADLPATATFQKVALQPQERAGVLSHPYLMANFAYTASSSPIHRGVFLARNVLGVALRPPLEAFTPLPAELHPELTTRERISLQTRPQQCQACHGLINPLGFTMEHFDAIGRFRDQERGKTIDATGAYQTHTGALVKFAGVRDLGKFLAHSDEAQEAFVEHLFHYLVKQPIRAYGLHEAARLRRDFAQHDCNIRKLMVEIMTTAALPPAQEAKR